ncbi:MAG: DUF1127 domain-containing protein [Cypionkella sp.]|jgi:uncharacterized protein YjiS (DUF1127 family)|nr:DUF1127 domain-containing protein [Cypionkella sp.]
MAFVNSSRATTVGIADRAAAVVKTIRVALERRRIFKQTVRELQSLSNRELADLGIHRSMITRVANEAAYGK